MSSKMTPFWIPFDTDWLTFGEAGNGSKKVLAKCGTSCQKGIEMEPLSEPNDGKLRENMCGSPGHPLGYHFEFIVVPFLGHFGTSFDIDL